jgi:hypothetical protein
MDFLEEALVPVVALMLMTQINQQQAQVYNTKDEAIDTATCSVGLKIHLFHGEPIQM